MCPDARAPVSKVCLACLSDCAENLAVSLDRRYSTQFDFATGLPTTDSTSDLLVPLQIDPCSACSRRRRASASCSPGLLAPIAPSVFRRPSVSPGVV
jgi:hypothetical protein